MDMKLSGKTVLITGGSRGIGFACAMAFASEGCAVHIASRSKESLESAREKIEAGAELLQIYTGFIYRGPNLIRELAKL